MTHVWESPGRWEGGAGGRGRKLWDLGRRGLGCGVVGRKAGAGLQQWYLEVDEDGGSQYPKALQEVPQHVHKCCPDAGVPQGQGLFRPLLQRCILCSPRPVAVGGSSLVQHKGHSEGEAKQLSPGACSWPPMPHLHAPFSHLPRSPFPAPGKKQRFARETNNAAWGKEYQTWCHTRGFGCWLCYLNRYMTGASYLSGLTALMVN